MIIYLCERSQRLVAGNEMSKISGSVSDSFTYLWAYLLFYILDVSDRVVTSSLRWHRLVYTRINSKNPKHISGRCVPLSVFVFVLAEVVNNIS